MLQGLIIYCSKFFTTIVGWLEQNMLPCYFKYFFGIDCPGCGLQRSIILLLKGNFGESIQMYPPLLPIVFVLLLHFLNKQVNYKNKAILFKLFVWTAAGITAANFLYKLIVRITNSI